MIRVIHTDDSSNQVLFLVSAAIHATPPLHNRSDRTIEHPRISPRSTSQTVFLLTELSGTFSGFCPPTGNDVTNRQHYEPSFSAPWGGGAGQNQHLTMVTTNISTPSFCQFSAIMSGKAQKRRAVTESMMMNTLGLKSRKR